MPQTRIQTIVLKRKRQDVAHGKSFFAKKKGTFEFYSAEKHKGNKSFPTQNVEVLRDDDLWRCFNIRNEISLFESKHYLKV